MKPLLVLRPEPGNRATVDRARSLGLEARACPLFAVEPVTWSAPNVPAGFILFTSANAPRHGGAGLANLTNLPALAVGEATADAARAAGFDIAMTGEAGVDALLDALPGSRRLLHLAGADHRHADTRHAVETVVVYRSVALTDAAIPPGPSVALVHSARAAARLGELAPHRAAIAIAAISAAAAAACGTGWAALEVADRPSDGALLALAARLCQDQIDE